MANKPEIILPLHQLFEQLQTYERQLKHKSLSTDSYLLLVDMLKDGYGLVSMEDLYFLCKIFWFRPHFSEIKFKALFDSHLAPFQFVEQIPDPKTSTEEKEISPSDKTNTDKNKNPQPTTETPKSEEEVPTEKTEEVTEKSETENFETVSLIFKTGRVADAELEAPDLKTLEQSIFQQPYRLKGKYFPVGKRKIQQSILSLRVLTKDRTQEIIDWPSTIDRVASRGYFDQVEFRKTSKITNQVCLLIDNGQSMVAFHQLADEIALAVKQYQSKEKPQVYYFNNCPVNYLYVDKSLTDAILLEEFIAQINQPIFIISDAGAARGLFDRDRISQTQKFLSLLSNRPLAWLNPMPRFRWTKTSAAFIANLVPMFAINPRELSNAIKLFKQLK